MASGYLFQSAPTSNLLWMSALFLAVFDLGLVGILSRRIPRARFERLRLPIIGIAALFWGLVYALAVSNYWFCYRYVFPGWVQWAAPVYGLFLGGLAWIFWNLALRLPIHPVLGFCFLGGLHSFPGHIFGIYILELLEECPFLQQVEPPAALIFGLVEFILYWGIILGLGSIFLAVWERLRPTETITKSSMEKRKR